MNLLRKKRDKRALNPVFINATAKMKTPKMKKTASFPNNENEVFASTTFNKGNNTIAKRPVTERGMIFVTQKNET